MTAPRVCQPVVTWGTDKIGNRLRLMGAPALPLPGPTRQRRKHTDAEVHWARQGQAPCQNPEMGAHLHIRWLAVARRQRVAKQQLQWLVGAFLWNQGPGSGMH